MEGVGLTAKNSTSLQRAPGPLDQSVKGDSTHFPFWPGMYVYWNVCTYLCRFLSVYTYLGCMCVCVYAHVYMYNVYIYIITRECLHVCNHCGASLRRCG